MSFNYLYFTVFTSLFFLTIYPNPPCQLSLWEETGEHGENPSDIRLFDTGLEPMTSVEAPNTDRGKYKMRGKVETV